MSYYRTESWQPAKTLYYTMLDSSFDAKISAAIINRCCTEAMWGRLVACGGLSVRPHRPT
jgi:hypothetical protein